MSIFHCQIKNISRSGGRSAVASAAYRAGDNIKNEETGIQYDYTRKSGIEYSEIILCENAPEEYKSRAVLWNAVQKIEKSSDARLCREWEVAIPKELSLADGQQLVRDFAKSLAAEGMCVDFSIHDKGDGNRHAHILGTTRAITEKGEWAPKAKKVYDLDDRGERIYQKTDKTGKKIYKNHKEDYNDWNKTGKVEEWRERWARECNKYLTAEERIDHRSNERRGLEALSTVHEGYAARQIEKNGGVSELCQINRDIREYNGLSQQIQALQTVRERLVSILKEIARKAREMFKNERFSNLQPSGDGRSDEGSGRNDIESDSGSRGLETPSGRIETDDTDAFIREAETIISDSRANEADSGADRANREAERQRLNRERQREAEKRQREAEKRKRGSYDFGDDR